MGGGDDIRAGRKSCEQLFSQVLIVCIDRVCQLGAHLDFTPSQVDNSRARAEAAGYLVSGYLVYKLLWIGA